MDAAGEGLYRPTLELTVAAARVALRAAVACAERLDIRVSIALVDAGGNLKAFVRMDGAEVAGPTLAVDKAYTAVANRIATDELAELTAPGAPLFGLHANAGGRYVIFGGGVPIAVGTEIVGAVGVSGALVEQDAECARAGAAACSVV